VHSLGQADVDRGAWWVNVKGVGGVVAGVGMAKTIIVIAVVTVIGIGVLSSWLTIIIIVVILPM
jgi:hypothetical protein